MTNSQLHSDEPPSPRQRRYIHDLRMQVGESGPIPHTKAEASAEIKRLKSRRRLAPAERRREAFEARREAGEMHGDAAAIRPDEISGYGSNCRWLHQTRS